jgi:hypothetical protein
MTDQGLYRLGSVSAVVGAIVALVLGVLLGRRAAMVPA